MTGLSAGARLLAVLRLLPALAWRSLRAWATLEPSDWSKLADLLIPVAAAFPKSCWAQHAAARVLRAGWRSDEAIAVSRRALGLNPENARLMLELGKALRQAGQRADAIATLAQACSMGAKAAAAELRRYAARSALPVPDAGIHARSAYAAYAQSNPPPAPPPTLPAAHFNLQVLGPGDQLATLESLERQTYPHWTLDAQTQGQQVRLRIFTVDVPAGAILDPNCLAWLNHAVAVGGAGTVRADHDHYRPDGRRCDPVFLPPQPDLLWTEGRDSIVRLAAHAQDGADGIYHMPLVLMALSFTPAEQITPAEAEPLPISVIIPSRDNPELLATAIATLRATATRPDLVELIVVDNASRTAEALALNGRLRREAGVKVVSFNEPFNWSRANNLGAAAASGEMLLFLNDDTAMLTRGWDRILAALFERPEVGLVGARMTYPDGTIQHGGFVFGMDNGPQHEGRWMAGDDCGPAGRWTAIRQAAGVTGAFMAIRAADFEKFGRYDDAAFAVDFADLDLCLRVRAAGKAVVYCGAISLTHHESVSRGLNLGRRKRRRMRTEWLRFRKRWGQLALRDPWYHPVWARTGASYDGLVQFEGCDRQAQKRLGL